MRWANVLVFCAGFASLAHAQADDEILTTPSFTGNYNTTSSSSSSIPQLPTSLPSNSTTTQSSIQTTEPPAEPSTSFLTLSASGGTKTVIYTDPNMPGSTVEVPTGPTADPSLVTGPNTGSQTTISRSAIALLGFSAFFIAFA